MVEIIVWREQLLPPAMLSFRTGGRLPPSLAIPSSARDRPATRSPCLSGGYPLRFSRRVCTSVLGCDGGPVVRLIREGGYSHSVRNGNDSLPRSNDSKHLRSSG